MSCNGILILSIAWILTSPVWFFVIGNTAAGMIWLCGGIVELVIAQIRRDKEKKSKKNVFHDSENHTKEI